MKWFLGYYKGVMRYFPGGYDHDTNFSVFHDHDRQKLHPFNQNHVFTATHNHDYDFSLFLAIVIGSVD